MSVFTFSGMLLAFPATLICCKLGLKKTVLLAMIFLLTGCLAESLSASMIEMYLSRLIEGIGVGLIGVAAPACVSVSFPEEKRGFALGIWATWMPMGITLIYNTAPLIAGYISWRAVAALLSAACGVLFMLFYFLFDAPEEAEQQFRTRGKPGNSIRKISHCLANKNIWLLGICFFAFSYCSGGVTDTHYNVFLQSSAWHFDPQEAASLVSLIAVIGMAAIPVSGWLFDHVPLQKKHYLIMFAALGDLLGFSVAWDESSFFFIALFIVTSGLGQGFIAGTVRPMVPLVLGNSTLEVTTGMAVLTIFQSLGRVIGSPLFGIGYETFGWWHAAIVLVLPICLLSIVTSFFIKPRKLSS